MGLRHLAAAAVVLGSAASGPAGAQSVADFPPRLLPAWWTETHSTPRGWSLAYQGEEGGVLVYVMTMDLKSHPMTAMLDPTDQIRRAVCGDEGLAQLVREGLRLRIDARRVSDDGVQVKRGTVISSCSG